MVRKVFFIGILAFNICLFLFFTIDKQYPPIAVIVNIISVLFLIGLQVKPQPVYNSFKKHPVDIAICVGLFVLALSFYVFNIDVITPGVQGDEMAIAVASEQILTSSQFLPFVPVNEGHPTPLLYLTGLSIKTFGRSVLAIRLPYVIFGALSIATFYILLRLFFRKDISMTAALLMLFSYPFIIISRLAYEVTPEIFFQLVTAIFLYLAWKTKDIRYFIAIGLSLGLGLYTYVGFRTFTIAALLLTVYLIFKTSRGRIMRYKLLLVTIGSLFIVSVPLLSYSATHLQDVMARTTILSPLNQNYPPTEIMNELFANVGRLPRLFFMGDPKFAENGDTNFLMNPANASLFDIGTFIFFIIGLIYLVKTNKKLFWVILIFALVSLINDLLVIDRYVGVLHPYGVGHPNTLRLAGLIPIIYFVIAYGLNPLKTLLNKGEMKFSYIIYFFLACIMFYNWYLYYEQPANQVYSFYIDNHNGVYTMNIVNWINENNLSEVAVSPQFLSDDRFHYFLKKGVRVKMYNPNNYSDAIQKAQENQATFFYALTKSNIQLAQQILTQGPIQGLEIEPLSIVDGTQTLYAVEFIKVP